MAILIAAICLCIGYELGARGEARYQRRRAPRGAYSALARDEDSV